MALKCPKSVFKLSSERPECPKECLGEFDNFGFCEGISTPRGVTRKSETATSESEKESGTKNRNWDAD